MNNNAFDGDIERAERLLLAVSWVGAVCASFIVGYSIWCLL